MIFNLSPNNDSSSSSNSATYAFVFSASDWNEDGTITISPDVHGLSGSNVKFDVLALSEGVYVHNTWAALETYATIDEENVITLHYQEMENGTSTTGYDGKVFLTCY